jgi:hypothetical protein
MSEDKVRRKDLCGSVRAVYVLEKLPDVSGPGLIEAGRYIHRAFIFVGVYISNSSLNIYFHYYDYIDYNFIMSTGQEGLGEHIRGPATPEHEVFLPSAREKALMMKASMTRRLRKEDLHTEKASKTKTFMPRRP